MKKISGGGPPDPRLHLSTTPKEGGWYATGKDDMYSRRSNASTSRNPSWERYRRNGHLVKKTPDWEKRKRITDTPTAVRIKRRKLSWPLSWPGRGWGLCALRHGIQISMDAILACHPVRSTEWLDCHPKSCELWRIRTGPIDPAMPFRSFLLFPLYLRSIKTEDRWESNLSPPNL